MTLQVSANSAFSTPVSTALDMRRAPSADDRCVRCNQRRLKCTCTPSPPVAQPVPVRKGLSFSVDSLLGNTSSSSSSSSSRSIACIRTPPPIRRSPTPPLARHEQVDDDEEEEEEEINVHEDTDLGVHDNMSEHSGASSPRSAVCDDPAAAATRPAVYPGAIPPHPFLAEAAKWPGIGGVALTWLPGFTPAPRKCNNRSILCGFVFLKQQQKMV